MLLDKFRRVKLEEVERLRASSAQLPPYTGLRPSFSGALRDGCGSGIPALIAEYKRASPSRGRICESVTPEAAADAYFQGGASAMSVLTEEEFFQGRIGFLARCRSALPETAMPLLRKDFILDPVQVEATIATPASAMLLIVRLTPDPVVLRSLREQAEAAGIEAVVEVFDETDLAIARESGASIIQVNARDLETFRVDTQAGMDLIRRCPPRGREVWIAASGIARGAQMCEAREAGFTAVLVGTSLMQDGTPRQAVTTLLAQARAGRD